MKAERRVKGDLLGSIHKVALNMPNCVKKPRLRVEGNYLIFFEFHSYCSLPTRNANSNEKSPKRIQANYKFDIETSSPGYGQGGGWGEGVGLYY